MAGTRDSNDAHSDEFQRIAQYFAPLTSGPENTGEAFGLRDDAALLDVPADQQLVLTKDMMAAGVHFFADDAPDLIARKLLRVNLSDLAGMGAVPVGYLLGLGVTPDIDDAWVAAFAEGLAADQQTFGVTLLGGDSIASPTDITLSLTALGQVAKGQALTRSGAQAGDVVYVSGTIGDAALGLLAVQGHLPDADDFLKQRYWLPQPRAALGPVLCGVAHAAMDISDGLLADLGHMAAASDVAIHLEQDAIPLSAAAQSALQADGGLWQTILTGGDDYELAFAAPPGAAVALENLAAQIDIPLTRIGHVAEGAGVQICDSDGRAPDFAQTGYRHFP